MRVPGFKTVRRSLRRLRGRLVGGGMILGYHRIASDQQDPFSLCVSPEHFEQQLAVLRERFNLLSLAELCERLERGDLPQRSVALTFDDGYADLLAEALPLLRKFSAPATVFVVSGAIGKTFWWDELVEIVFKSSELPDRLQLAVDDVEIQWRRERGAGDTESRRRMLATVYQRLRSVEPATQCEIVRKLRVLAGANIDPVSCASVLSENELKELAGDPLIEIGSHTVSHPLLEKLSRLEQDCEIRESKLQLEAIIGRTVESFSYPNGSLAAMTPELVRTAGYQRACTSDSDCARVKGNPFCLPRLWIPNVDGGDFASRLHYWLG